jgi:hypothetical protein
MPDGEEKHQFWETGLIQNRAKELIEMDVSGKLN